MASIGSESITNALDIVKTFLKAQDEKDLDKMCDLFAEDGDQPSFFFETSTPFSYFTFRSIFERSTSRTQTNKGKSHVS